jgi:hypothetical protein
MREQRHTGKMRVFGLVAAIIGATAAQGQVPVISADRQAVHVGDSVTLTWRSSADSAFISGIGKVTPSGTKTLVPEGSVDFVLITQTAQSIQSAAIHVTVQGEKGDPGFPDPDEFQRGANGSHSSTKYPDFLDLAFTTLQDQLRFRVKGDFLPHRSFQTLYTDRQTRQELLKDNPPGIRQRRIAYAVEIEQPAPNGAIAFRVKTLVEYQRIGESRWRPESNIQVGLTAAQDVMQRLERTPPK